MIELAKNVGATFALSVIQRPARDGNGNGNNNVVRDTDFAPEDPQVDRVTETDLAKLFDITPRQLVDTRWVVERYVGTEQKEPLVFDGYHRANPSEKASDRPTGAASKPAAAAPGGAPTTTQASTSAKTGASVSRGPVFKSKFVGHSASSSDAIASGGEVGFRPVASNSTCCENCGHKR